MTHADDMIGDYCVVCGQSAGAKHHEPARGMGGRKTEPPRLALCGVGNDDARCCHGARHHGMLRFRHFEGRWWWNAKPGYCETLKRRGLMQHLGHDIRPDSFYECKEW